LWHGTAASAVDLTPPGSFVAFANAISGSQIVGRYRIPITGEDHAIIWNDLGTSFTDVNPAGAGYSELLATSGEWQVGDVAGAFAYVWHGTAESAVNLQAFLPPNYVASQANGVDADGNIIGQAYDGASGQTYAVLWLVPEPSCSLVFATYALALFRRQRI
jgi:hypothetical protein